RKGSYCDDRAPSASVLKILNQGHIQYDVLVSQDLGTIEKLLALADWPAAELHQLFQEALPRLTVPQRYILIKGMKKYAANLG
ncbi:hypothetical protein DXG03_007493, partial [Asterophora parasitica]